MENSIEREKSKLKFAMSAVKNSAVKYLKILIWTINHQIDPNPENLYNLHCKKIFKNVH